MTFVGKLRVAGGASLLALAAWSGAVASAAEVRLGERVALTLADVPQADLPATPQELAAHAAGSVARELALPGGAKAKLSWSAAPDMCRKINSLGRLELQTWKTQMEGAAQQTFPRNAGWVSTSNIERIEGGGGAGPATLIVYRFGRQAPGGKLELRIMIDVFGATSLGSITLDWTGTEADAAGRYVSAVVNSIGSVK